MDLSLSTEVSRAEISLGREALLAGDGLGAVAAFEGPAAAAPSDAEAHYWLASARLLAGDPVGAEHALDTGRVLQCFAVARDCGVDIARCRADAVYASQEASRFYAQGLVAVSTVILGFALTGDKIAPGDLLQYGLALQHQGRCEEAGAVFRWAAETFPSPPVEQFVIYPQIFCEDGDARHAAAARAWAKRYAPSTSCVRLNNPSGAGRKLHLGYVAPTFARSQLRQFIAPLLEHHDPTAFEVTLYTTTASTEEGWPDWIKIRPIGALDDADAAELIRDEGVDILSDCWGHTAGSRIGLFALRPAPVQVAWMNFIQTSGLEAMDYVLHGDAKGEKDAEGLFTEEPWPIGPVFNAFRPVEGRLPPTSTPALRTGQMTFGSFNHPAKLSGSILDAWGAILRGAPTSRLLLKYRYFADPVLQRATQARFAARGVAPERIVFDGHSAGVAYFEAFRDVDLMLDTWPAPGSTTTLDALSNGVPVLAKPTPTSGGRCVRAILEASGLGEMVAATPEDYVALALALAGDVQRLDALRARVRPSFEAGACCDEIGFTRRVESAFCTMFDRWRSSWSDNAAHG